MTLRSSKTCGSLRHAARGEALQMLERVGLRCGLVGAPAQDARKAHGDAALVARRRLDRLERQLEDQLRLDPAYRAEALERVCAHPCVDVANLGVGQSRVRLRKWNELAAAPYRERVVGVERR